MKTALKFGIILGFSLIIMGVLIDILHLEKLWWLQFISLGVLGVIVVVGAQEARNEDLGGFAKYGQILGRSVLIVAIGALISMAYLYLSWYVIDPGKINEMLILQEQQLEEHPFTKNLTEEQKQLQIERARMMMPYTPVMGAVWMVFVGVLIALVSSAFIAKKKPQELLIKEELQQKANGE